MTLQGMLNNVYYLIAVDKSGKETSDSVFANYVSWAKYANVNAVEQKSLSFDFDGVTQNNLAYLKLMRRKREFVTFDGFATKPTTTPPAGATTVEAEAAEKDRDHRIAQAQIADAQTKRKAWDAIPADPKTPQGLMRELILDARGQDAAALRKRLLATDPQANKMLDEMVQLFMLNQSIRGKAVELFGEEKVASDFGQQPFLVDLEQQLMQFQWKLSADGQSYSVPDMQWYVLRRDTDGNLFMDCDGMLKQGRGQVLTMEVYCASLVAKGRQVDKLMNRAKPPTEDELKVALGNLPAPPDGNQ
jgi:hypothetical protein